MFTCSTTATWPLYVDYAVCLHDTHMHKNVCAKAKQSLQTDSVKKEPGVEEIDDVH